MEVKWEKNLSRKEYWYCFNPSGPLMFKYVQSLIDNNKAYVEISYCKRAFLQFSCDEKVKDILVKNFIKKFVAELIDTIKEYDKNINKKWVQLNSYWQEFDCHHYNILISQGGSESHLKYQNRQCSTKHGLQSVEQTRQYYRSLLFDDLIKVSAMLRN